MLPTSPKGYCGLLKVTHENQNGGDSKSHESHYNWDKKIEMGQKGRHQWTHILAESTWSPLYQMATENPKQTATQRQDTTFFVCILPLIYDLRILLSVEWLLVSCWEACPVVHLWSISGHPHPLLSPVFTSSAILSNFCKKKNWFFKGISFFYLPKFFPQICTASPHWFYTQLWVKQSATQCYQALQFIFKFALLCTDYVYKSHWSQFVTCFESI